MQKLKRRLPSLNALFCFEAAGRHLSFTRAADELCVTQGAVSRQIREIEAALGIKLFRRGHRSIEMTDDGRRYHHSVTVALEHLADATEDVVARPKSRQVTVAATTAISMHWMLPRIPDLHARFPDIDVQVLATDAELSTLEDAYDIGIQYGHGRWPDLDETYLCAGEIVPVCSPQFLGNRAPFGRAEDLLDQPLIQLDDKRMDWISWPAWFRAAGVEGPYPSPALRVNDVALLNKSAFEGHGIALGMKQLLDKHFARNWLVAAHEFSVLADFGFYVVAPRSRPLSLDGRIVCDWIKSQFRK